MVKAEALVTTYLEMRAAPEASRDHKSQVSGLQLRIQELEERNWKFNRDMYFQVGERWKWIDKRPWTDAQWDEYASDPALRTFAGYCGDQVAGYFELKRTAASPSAGQHEGNPTRHKSHVTRHSEAEIEIAYFGLLPEFIGRGLGGELLGRAIETAWGWAPPPSRVWVHTCNRDHPSALKNYQARGFKIYKVETLSG